MNEPVLTLRVNSKYAAQYRDISEIHTRVKLETYCGECGRGLCLRTVPGETPGRGVPILTIYPCKNCLAAERKRIRDKFKHKAAQK